MLFAATGQAVVFLATMYAGLVIGIIYDALRALRWVTRAKKALTAVTDVAFSIAAMAVFLYSLVTANNGCLYGYTVMGAVCGALLYFCGLSPMLLPILRKLGEALKMAVLFIWRSTAAKKILK